MASVYQRGTVWWIGYTDAEHVRKAVPTKAKTKGEARALAQELDGKAWRVRHGLEAGPTGTKTTLWELCTWWLESRCPDASQERERSRLHTHVERTALGKLLLPAVTAERVEDYLRAIEQGGASPSSCNRLRAILRCVFSRAIVAKRWAGANPLLGVEHRKAPKPHHETLTPDEVGPVLAHTPQPWRDIFATALYTGMRKGELLGLRKAAVDMRDRTIRVERSYGRETTKGKHADTIPIADPLLPYLEHALEASPSELVFPRLTGRKRGQMRPEDSKLELVLRRALGRAGLVTGYEHVCRRCKHAKRDHAWRFADKVQRRCPAPECGMLLWARALPRHMTFHELRHTSGTLMLRAGIDLHRVQRVLRHSDPRLTADTYAHLAVEDLRVAVAAIGGSSATTKPLQSAGSDSGEAPNSPVISECARRDLNPRHPDSKNDVGSVQAMPDCAEGAEIIPFWTPVQPVTFRPKPGPTRKSTAKPLQRRHYSSPRVVCRPGFWLRSRDREEG